MRYAHTATSWAPSRHFLWNKNSPLKKAGGAWKLRAEASEIIWGSLRAYPIQQLNKSLHNFFEQFVSFSTGSNLIPRLEGSYTNRVIQDVFGSSVHARYMVSRQNVGKLPISTAKWVHNITIIVSIPIVVFLFIIFVRRKESLYVSLFILILFGLIGNAFITGVFSVVDKSVPEPSYLAHGLLCGRWLFTNTEGFFVSPWT